MFRVNLTGHPNLTQPVRSSSLDDNDLEIIRKEKVNGRVFLNITEEKLRNIGLSLGLASNIAVFAKDCKEKKLKAFSSYRSLKEVL